LFLPRSPPAAAGTQTMAPGATGTETVAPGSAPGWVPEAPEAPAASGAGRLAPATAMAAGFSIAGGGREGGGFPWVERLRE
jgi:hypothetical protein